MYLSVESAENLKNGSSDCMISTPTSSEFCKHVYQSWDYGGYVFLGIPPFLTVIIFFLFIEEICFIFSKGNSKKLKKNISWILASFPAIMLIGTVAIFVPLADLYLRFLYGLFAAVSVSKYFNLIMAFSGGRRSFIEKSCEEKIGLNLFPCCIFYCLPTLHNSAKLTQTAKWLILQNLILTPFYGSIGVILQADEQLTTRKGVVMSLILTTLKGIATVICMYGLRLLSTLALNINRMERVHAVQGKTLCLQIVIIITGFEGIVFKILEVCGWFPCIEPLNFAGRTRVIFNYAVIIEVFVVALMARRYFRREIDVKTQSISNNRSLFSDNTPNQSSSDAIDAVDVNTHSTDKHRKEDNSPLLA